MNINYKRKEKETAKEFTEGRAELRAYQFNKYISSCTCYLMDQRLKEKRRLYNGLDNGFEHTKKQELVLKKIKK